MYKNESFCICYDNASIFMNLRVCLSALMNVNGRVHVCTLISAFVKVCMNVSMSMSAYLNVHMSIY